VVGDDVELLIKKLGEKSLETRDKLNKKRGPRRESNREEIIRLQSKLKIVEANKESVEWLNEKTVTERENFYDFSYTTEE